MPKHAFTPTPVCEDASTHTYTPVGMHKHTYAHTCRSCAKTRRTAHTHTYTRTLLPHAHPTCAFMPARARITRRHTPTSECIDARGSVTDWRPHSCTRALLTLRPCGTCAAAPSACASESFLAHLVSVRASGHGAARCKDKVLGGEKHGTTSRPPSLLPLVPATAFPLHNLSRAGALLSQARHGSGPRKMEALTADVARSERVIRPVPGQSF